MWPDDGSRVRPAADGKTQEDCPGLGRIQRLGLEKHVAELEAVGYTVIPPEKLTTPAFLERLRGAFCATVERRTGMELDLARTGALEGQGAGAWAPFTFLLFEDPVFQEAILNPVPLALADYTVGRSCMFSTCIGLVKGPGPSPLGLHTDNGALGIPAPYPAYPLLLNCTWVLTDYSKSGGALCLVPGTHSLGHGPGADEVTEPVAIEAPAGSMVVGSAASGTDRIRGSDPGLRLTLVTYLHAALHRSAGALPRRGHAGDPGAQPAALRRPDGQEHLPVQLQGGRVRHGESVADARQVLVGLTVRAGPGSRPVVRFRTNPKRVNTCKAASCSSVSA